MDAPTVFKEFHGLFTSLIYKYDVSMVFDDFLDYCIRFFLLDDSISWEKRYTTDENKIFMKMMQEWIRVMNQQCITSTDWFDFFGEYYEAEIVSKLGRKGSGQFFTPPDLCDLMSQLLFCHTQPIGCLFNDPSCGSGRCLISKHVHAPGNYHVAEDLDQTCVKMTILNFLVHGIQGEVIWHNSLTLEWFGAWKVNETLHLTGLPSVKSIPESECRCLHQKTPAPKPQVTLEDYPVKQEAK